MSKSKVSIVKTKQNPGYPEIRDAVGRALDLIGGIGDVVKSGNLVLINPNLVFPIVEREAGCITLPEVTKAVADIVKEQGARAVIAESAAVGVDTQKVIDSSGYKNLRDQGYEIVDLKRTKIVKLPVRNGLVLDEIETFELVQQADVIISVPKIKTHDQFEITLSMKKMKGLISDNYKRLFHQKFGVVEGVVDIMSVFKPALAVVDGIICQEGLGPVFGRPVEMDLIVAGKDLVAVDSVCGRIAEIKLEELFIEKKAAERGLGNLDPDAIEIVGEKLENVKRRFLRNSEDNPVEVEGFSLIFGGITCTGCRNTVTSALVDMRRQGSEKLKYLPGVTVMTGDLLIPVGTSEDSIVAVGKCVPKEKRGKRFVPGCPPNNASIIDAIIAGREEVGLHYGKKVKGKKVKKVLLKETD